MTRRSRRPTRCSPTRRCTRRSRIARARPTASSRRSTTTRTSTRWRRGARALQAAGARDADVLHLHHLTPLHEAAARVAPGVPIVGHLHGTELLMLEAIEADPDRWPHAAAWADRMRAWAAACERVIVLSDDPGRPRRGRCSGSTRSAACWSPTASTRRRSSRARSTTPRSGAAHLVDEPRGLGARATSAGSVRYEAADLDAFEDGRARRRCCSTSAASPRSSACRADRGLRARASPASRAARRS